jgi:hypothetical protein
MNQQSPTAELMRLVTAYRISQAIYVAATLGIADLLKDGARSSDDLAAATGAHPRSLYRLLRALAAAGVFHEDEGQRFSLTPVGEGLRTDMPASLGAQAAFIGRPYYWQVWGDLLHSVRTGENAFRHVHGIDVWEYRAERPEESALFDNVMTTGARGRADAVLAAYDFGRFKRIMDVGGGQGALLTSILTAHPAVRGVLFDQPHVVSGAGEVLRLAGVADRCEVVAGSFFDEMPQGADAHILQQIVHDWDDEAAAAILRTCRRAIAPGGTLIVIEQVIAPPNQGGEGKFMDLNMLVAPGGQERNREEFAALFAAAGFTLTDVIPTASPAGIVVATPS